MLGMVKNNISTVILLCYKITWKYRSELKLSVKFQKFFVDCIKKKSPEALSIAEMV